MKQTSPNVFICPDKTYHRIANKDMTFTTQILKELEKKMRIRLAQFRKRGRRRGRRSKRRNRKRRSKKSNKRRRRKKKRRQNEKGSDYAEDYMYDNMTLKADDFINPD